jgi:hypothetical protein
LPFKKAAAKRKRGRAQHQTAKRKRGSAQHQTTRCTKYGWPVGPTLTKKE